MRGFADAIVHDLRSAVRSMLRTPGFTAVAILMIALGTGANAAMFSVIDGVMLRSPFPGADRVAMVTVRTASGQQTSALSLAQYRSLVETAREFDAVAAIVSGTRPVLTGLGEPKRFNAECVTAGMFRVLGTPPIAGRVFTRDEDRPGAPAVVVLSYQFWQREMSGAPDAVGRGVTLDGVPATIVGIMPRGFGGPYSRNNNDGWLPGGAVLDGGSAPGCAVRGSVNPFARVKGARPLDVVAREASDQAGIARLEDWQGKVGGQLGLVPLEAQTTSDLRGPLFALLGAVGLVLLIACANVANLQMERIFGRRAELGVRMALGATRGRIVRQTLMENLLLSIAGCAAGLLLASWTLDLVVGLLPASMPRLSEIDINPRILAATFGVACAAGIGVGLLPALRGSSAAVMNDLRASVRTATAGGYARTGLVLVQVALSLVLLIGATLMIRTFDTLRPSNPGFAPADKLTISVRPQGAAATDSRVFYERALERLRAIPGVQAAEGSSYLPMSGSVAVVTVAAAGTRRDAWSGVVTPGYFAAMEIPILRGRGFGGADRPGGAPVAIVNEAFARRWWPQGDALGQAVDVEYFGGRKETRQIVGIARDGRSSGADLRARPEIYTPLAQTGTPLLHLIVRASRPGDPRLASAVKSAIAAVDGTQVVDRIVPLQDLLDSRVATWRFGAWLLGVFVGMALLLAAVGLTAAMAWWVTRRTREIGVRMALGASPRTVLRMVMAQGLGLAIAGVAVGLAGAAFATRLLEGWLYGVTPLDRPTFAGAALAMLVIAAVATLLPARRAVSIDPLATLRTE